LDCLQDKYDTPLVADIHFQPKVAMMVAEAFEKVRVNPGNFADGRKTFEQIDYDDPKQFEMERANIEEVFTPLVLKCKDLGTAMRIGTNHGSLSARILSYYGDTPAGVQPRVQIRSFAVLKLLIRDACVHHIFCMSLFQLYPACIVI
jgi:(E)-4-hydroxy-3-methylbut-2-enyl-diphosphate synthase